MKNITLVLTLAQLFFSVAAFLVPRKLVTGSLVIRQGNGTLKQCESSCSPVIPYVGSGASSQCTPQACCTTAFEKSYLKCFTCIGKAENITNYSQYQNTLDDLTSACLADGISVPKLTFPGQNPHRTLTSFTPSSTPATGPGTGIAASTITTPGATVSLTTGVVANPTQTRNTGIKNANNTFSALVVLLLGILIS